MVTSVAARPGRDVAQQAAYNQAFKDVAAHVELDDAFSKVKGAVESTLGLLQKQAQVRVRNWLKKLSEETANVVWKKNRNAYARLLLEQLRRGTLAEPFGMQPPDGPLPTLPKHMAYAFKPASNSSPAAAVPTMAASQLQHSQTQLLEQQQQLSATEQLDQYLGRADFRRAQFADEQTALALPAGGRVAGSGGGGNDLQYLPGTRMQLRGAEGRRVDRHQLNDVGWQPSKLELEAQLGASRERQVELEWRLQQMEGLLHQHTALVQLGRHGGAAPPLGSLLDAMEDTGHVMPSPRQRAGKKELEELIERYECKRQQWPSPPKRTRTAQPALAPRDEGEILEQLDNFQRQTESIRRALGSDSTIAGGSPSHMPPSSSLAAAASGWGVPEATPLRQHSTGLHGSEYTLRALDGGRAGLQQQSQALFDGLPLSSAALASSRWQSNRHVEHAGHFEHSVMSNPQQEQQQQQEQIVLPRTDSGGKSRLAGGGAEQQQLRQPRSPIGLDTRHTKKSAAAAAERASASAGAALQRLKSVRQPAAAPAPSAASTQRPPADQQQDEHHQQQQQHHLVETRPVQPQQQQQQQRRDVEEATLQLQSNASVRQAVVPAPPQLPPDSNAALVAEVRQLRSKLLASLQKHAPEVAAAGGLPGISSSSYIGGLAAGPRKLPQRWNEEGGVSSRSGDTWCLSAVPATSRQSHPAVDISPSSFSLAAPGATVTNSSRKFRLTEIGSSDRGFSGDLSPALSARGGDTTPTSLDTGLDSLPRLSSLDVGSSLPPARNGSNGFSLESFEQRTEALRRQLAGL